MNTVISPEAQAMHELAQSQTAAVELRRKLINSLIFVVNFPLLVAILMGLDLIGFVHANPPTEGTFWAKVAFVAVIALIFLVVRKIAGIVYTTYVFLSCCTGLIFIPIFNILVGFASLWAIALIIPSLFQVSGNVLYGILAGLAIGAGQIPEIGKYIAPALKTEEEQQKKEEEKQPVVAHRRY